MYPSVSIEDIQQAASRLDGQIVHTPLIESHLLNKRLGGRILFKAECLQKTGSFKIRGALNKLCTLDQTQRASGVVAFSSGNHAQGVAAASHSLGIHAKIVIPRDAPELKIKNTRAWGAEVVLYDRHAEDRAQIAQDIAEREGRVLIPPYDDPHIIAGQGTVGLEIAEQLELLGVEADAVLCPCGGGGLIAGTATAMKERIPTCSIYSVEPTGFEDTQRSLVAGERLSNAPGAISICDSIVTERPGDLTFTINHSLLSAGIAVTDKSVLDAMNCAYTDLKLTVEPGGAVGLAALLDGATKVKGKTVVLILSGGNIDLSLFIEFQKSR